MTPQTEAVDLLAFVNSYARLPDKFFARLQLILLRSLRPVSLS
jgi:hypothetical protein